MASLSTSVSSASTPANRRWMITQGSSGHILQYMGSSSKTMYPQGASPGTAVVAGTSTATWSFEPATVSNRVLLINTTNGLPSTGAVRNVTPGQTLTLDNLNFAAFFISEYTNNQNINWVAKDPKTVNVRKEDGTVTGATPNDSTTVYARQTYNGLTYEKSYNINVSDVPDGTDYKVFHAQIYYDTSCGMSQSELRDIYQQATAGFLTQYNIYFNLIDITYASALDRSSNCNAVSADAYCPVSCGANVNCKTMHHSSSSRLLELVQPDSSTYTYRLVGYALCRYDTKKNSHSGVIGSGYVGGIHAISSVETSQNIARSIQHELTHNLGGSHDYCVSGEACVLKNNFGYWCSDCSSKIRNKLN